MDVSAFQYPRPIFEDRGCPAFAKIALQKTACVNRETYPATYQRLVVSRGINQKIKNSMTQRKIFFSLFFSDFDPKGLMAPYIFCARLLPKKLRLTMGRPFA